MPRHDLAVELQDLLLEPAKLTPEGCETCAGDLRNSPVPWIGADVEQLLDTPASDRRDNPELGKMGPDCINHRGLLTDEQMAWSVRQLCCSGVLVATNRMFALVTASQMASASVASFFCRLT
jgi:hypothetical protein